MARKACRNKIYQGQLLEIGDVLDRLDTGEVGLEHAASTLVEFAVIEVPIWPGITTDALRWGAFKRKSLTSASVKPFTANLAALYDVCAVFGPRDAQKPLTLLVLTTCPSGLASSIGRNARVVS